MKVDFRSKRLIIMDTPTGFDWVVYQDFVFSVQWEQDTIEEFVVSKGFCTNFASVPRLFWRVIPPIGRYNRAAVIHDWLYTQDQVPRKRADRIFLTAMKTLGVSWWRRRLMYRAVRLFGGGHRKKKKGLIDYG